MQKTLTRKSVLAIATAKYELQPPPYPLNALEPHMGQETLEYHWGKHHRGYVDDLNQKIRGTELDGMSLEDLVIASYNKGNLLPTFNSAAQVWNHNFFWQSMKPGGGGKPTGDLLGLIERDFGSFEGFTEEFTSAASAQFGSGWAWLAYKANRLDVENAVNPCPSETDKKLVVVKSPNSTNPLVWDYSHAYYPDFQNRRGDYVCVFLEKLVSWEAVSLRLEMAKARAAEREINEERKEEEAEKMGGEGDDGLPRMVLYVDDETVGREGEGQSLSA